MAYENGYLADLPHQRLPTMEELAEQRAETERAFIAANGRQWGIDALEEHLCRTTMGAEQVSRLLETTSLTREDIRSAISQLLPPSAYVRLKQSELEELEAAAIAAARDFARNVWRAPQPSSRTAPAVTAAPRNRGPAARDGLTVMHTASGAKVTVPEQLAGTSWFKQRAAAKQARQPDAAVKSFPDQDAAAAQPGRPEPVLIADFRAAELNAAEWMRHMGFDDAIATPTGADGGLDVVSSGAVAQVKAEATAAGSEAVQRLVGAAHVAAHRGKTCLFFTSAGYTRAARDYAEGAGVALFTYDGFGKVEAQNGTARRLLP